MPKLEDFIKKLRDEAEWLDDNAGLTKDKFNKGYFEGRAEQNKRLADALEQKALEPLTDD